MKVNANICWGLYQSTKKNREQRITSYHPFTRCIRTKALKHNQKQIVIIVCHGITVQHNKKLNK